jgi:hypothetical protein
MAESEPEVTYQPKFSGGATVGTGQRDAEGRYAAISPHVPEGSIVLDFGSERGYFAHRLAAERGCFVVAVDPKAEPRPGVRVVHEKLGPAGIRTLRAFNAALALSVLHHCVPWRDHLDALMDAAPLLFIETPHPDEVLRRVPRDRVVELYDHVLTLGPVICETGGVYDASILRPTVMVSR